MSSTGTDKNSPWVEERPVTCDSSPLSFHWAAAKAATRTATQRAAVRMVKTNSRTSNGRPNTAALENAALFFWIKLKTDIAGKRLDTHAPNAYRPCAWQASNWAMF